MRFVGVAVNVGLVKLVWFHVGLMYTMWMYGGFRLKLWPGFPLMGWRRGVDDV